jgi:hypothetical protein
MSKRRRRSIRPRCWRQSAWLSVRSRTSISIREKLIGDTAYGTAEMLNWLVEERGIEPHIPVWDKSQRTDGTFSRDDFPYDHTSDTIGAQPARPSSVIVGGLTVPRTGVMKDDSMLYRASKRD